MMAQAIMTDKDVIDLVRKEFERKLKNYCDVHNMEVPHEEKQEEDDLTYQEEPEEQQEIPNKPEKISIENLSNSIGLRVAHIDSGLEYYLKGINKANQTVELESPEGIRFVVDFDEFESDYVLG